MLENVVSKTSIALVQQSLVDLETIEVQDYPRSVVRVVVSSNILLRDGERLPTVQPQLKNSVARRHQASDLCPGLPKSLEADWWVE